MLAAASACESGPTSGEGSCEATEARDFSTLRKAANALVGELRYTQKEGSACEETGRPDATLILTIPDWTRLDQAERFFRDHDWDEVSQQRWTNSAYDFTVNVVQATEDGQEHIQLYLSLP